MKKKLALALSLMLVCSNMCTLGACGNKKMDISGIVKPTFEDTKGMIFTAYSGPTVENWSGSSRNVNTITEEHFQKFKEAGFNRLIAIHEGARAANNSDPYQQIRNFNKRGREDAMVVLDMAQKYGIEYYVRDWAFYDLHNYWNAGIDTEEEYRIVLEEMFDETNEYIHHPAYCGNFGRDEPGAIQFERIIWQINLYNEMLEKQGAKGEFLLNLLPAYGSDAAYGGVEDGGEAISYIEYVDRYFAEIAPLLGYVSYDFYPFLSDIKTGSMLRNNYLSNLSIMASRCKKGGYELRTFVQTGGDFTGLRDLTSIADFRFQVYTNMAFGSKQMTYYEYGTFKSQDEGEFGLINLQDGTYNYTYDLAKRVNNEVHAFEDEYLNFNFDGILTYSSKPATTVNVHFRGLDSGVKMNKHERIANVTRSEDAIIGAFKDKNGNDAFMLVNYTDPYYNLSNRVTIQFNDAKALLMYRFGEEYLVPLNADGTYTFELYPGEGRFIIPLK